MRRITFSLVVLFFNWTNYIQCQEDNLKSSEVKVNMILNRKYKKSVELTSGIMDSLKLKEFQQGLGFYLNSHFDSSKPIIIGFIQNGLNCLSQLGDQTYLEKLLSNYDKTLQYVAKEFDSNGYMMYTSDAFVSSYPCPNCIEDKGFMKRIVFTSDKNCMGFFVLLPNGEFYKYYGEDYFSIVDEVLSSKLEN